MNAVQTCELPPAAYSELADFLRKSASTLSPVEAASSPFTSGRKEAALRRQRCAATNGSCSLLSPRQMAVQIAGDGWWHTPTINRKTRWSAACPAIVARSTN
ncbi:hypothetical protein [Duganella sp. HH101]|uniref:hypothetical protein n=1 Tax=Duganella sp. HH101 TaxID=1781066 RepID=UPI000893A27C|nr:hypothetical protein [Duganella sp. HH101]OFA03259.1 hypothetical protein DUGA2_29850 [Duganella sp. HH101]